MSLRFLYLIPTLLCFLSAHQAFSQIVWQEDFSGANQGWTDNFNDCDAPGSAGVQNGRYEVTDMEGAPCCATGGGNDNEWVTNDIDISNACSVAISLTWGFTGVFECVAGGPYFGCSGNVSIDNGHDQMLFEYSLNGGAFVQFGYVCGSTQIMPMLPAPVGVSGLTGNTLKIRIKPANKSTAELYWFDNVTVTGSAVPTVNPPNDVTMCAGQSVPVNFTGNGNPAPTFSWTNDNTAIGLAAAGNGNIVLNPPANLGNIEVAMITVTPMSASCTGQPETFSVTVNPLPTVDAPANVTVCAGQNLMVDFTGNDPNATYNWVASVPLPGGGINGSGNINVQIPAVLPVAVTATVTVTATSNGCPGPPKIFSVTATPNPSGNLTLTGSANICAGQNAVFSVNITGGTAPFTIIYAINGVDQAPITTNNNPYTLNVPLSTTSVVNLVSVAANGCTGNGNGSANVNVTPTPTATIGPGGATVCTGQSTTIDVDLTGTGPFTFIYRINGINQVPVNTPGPTYSINVTPNNPGTFNYTLVSVTGNGCTGTVSGAYSLVVNQSPTATLSGGATVCAGQGTPLTVNFTGTGPFTFDYTADGVSQGPVTTSNNPFVFIVAPSTSTTYEITEVSAGGCMGTVQGIAVVTVNPSPSAVLTSGNVALCSGQTDTLRFALSGPSPYTFVYAVNGVSQPPITTSQSTYNIVVSPAASSTYTLVSVSGGGCNGFISGTYTITFGVPPAAVISGDTIICPGDTASLFIDFTGTGPFTYIFTANGISPDTVTTFSDPDTIYVAPVSTTAYVLTSVSSNGCSGTYSGMATVDIAPSVSASISGGGQICLGGDSISISVSFLGAGPYTFEYMANNVLQPPVTTSSNPYTFNVKPNIGTIYKLVSVTNGNCNGAVSGQAIVFVFTPPTAVMTGDQTFCDSAHTSVMVDFTGTGPFTIIYTIDGVAQAPDTTFDDPFIIPVNTTFTTVYKLISVESPGCVGTPQGMATVTINYKPTYANLNLTCNIAAGTYIVEFDVLGATLPLTLTTGSGSFTGAHFTSAAIPIIQGYNFVFHDANNCGDVTISGASTCSCTTDAGTMNLTPITACEGDTITATFNNNFVNDGNDILRFILHTNPALPVGTILAWNTAPTFTFQPGMTPGVTYYISAIAGNNDGSGNVNLADLCVSISQGTPVTFYALPTAVLGANDTICANIQSTIPVTMTGTPPFSLTYALNGVSQPTVNNILTSTYDITLQPAITTTITLVSVADSRCSTPVTDTAVIMVNTAPLITNLTTTCDFNTMTYTLVFNVGGFPPFSVTGIGGTFNGNQFTSVPIPSSSPYTFNVADAINCGQTTVSDTADCGCQTNAGVMNQTQVDACATQTLNVPVVSGEVKDNNDTLLYILHSNPGIPVGTIWAWNNTPQFTFQPGMQTNTVYYVSAIAGNPAANGQINLNDPCLSVATGTPVVFQPLPTADLGVLDTSICANQPVTLTVNFTGTPPFSFINSIGGILQPPVSGITDTVYSWTSSYGQNTTIQLDSVSDQYCSAGSVQGTANISMLSVPSITAVQTVCDSATQTYTVEFLIQNGAAPYTVTGLTGTVSGNQFISDPIPSGNSYTAFLNDVNNCGQDTVSGNVVCACATKAGTLSQTPLVLCADQAVNIPAAAGSFLDPNDTLIYVLATGPNPPGWTILATSTAPDFSFIPATMSPNTTYYIVAVAGNILGAGIDFSDPCLSVAAGPTVRWRPQVTATLSGTATVCSGTPANLNVQFGGDGPFSFIYSANGTQQQVIAPQNPYTLTVTPSSSTTYTLVSVSGTGGCSGTVSGSASVSVSTLQVLNIQTICDFATETYVLTFNISNGAAPNATYTVTGAAGTVTDSVFTSNPISALLTYSVVVSDPNGCSQTVSGEANCLCTTDAGTLKAVTADGCLPAGIVSVQTNGDQVLDTGDALQYILYQNAAQLPSGIIATSNTPQFSFQAGMTAGTTYFISAIAGNGTAAVDTTDPCLSISPGIPVVFHDPPTATLSGDSTFCAGNNATFQIKFTGTPVFNFVYAVNNNPQGPIPAPGATFNINTNNVQQNQVFTLISVADKYCSGTVSGQATVNIIPPPSGSLIGDATICGGGTSTIGLILSGGTSYDVTISGGAAPIQLNGIQSGATIDVTPAVTTTYVISAITATGNVCPPMIGTGVTVTVSSPAATAVVSDYNGFGVSCPNGDDGSISLTLTGGTQPVTAMWSNNLSGFQLNGLAPGSYVVTLTDQAGCVFIDTFILNAPPALTIELEIKDPGCFGGRDGSVTIVSVQGGAEPYLVGINGLPSQTVDTFPLIFGQLQSGDYTVEITDANGCVTEVDTAVLSPLPLNVDLGPDVTINFGDSTILNAIHNSTALDTFLWSPLNFINSPDSLITYVKPPESQIYNISVTDTSGCTATDEVRVIVTRIKRVFLPNIIKPASTETNDQFVVFAGPEVSKIRTMQIFDRWGEMLFENRDFSPNDPQFGWNGHARGKEVSPGVYVYVVEVEFIDGSTEIFSGDVTVVR